MPTTPTLRPRPIDATLSVTRAAQVLGVHPNTIRAWSDAGRLRYYRINPRGDRRYRMGDLQRFLASLAGTGEAGPDERTNERPKSWRRRSTGPRSPSLLPDERTGPPTAADAVEGGPATLALLGILGELTASAIKDAATDPVATLVSAVRAIRDATGALQVTAWRVVGDRIAPVAASGPTGRGLAEMPITFGILGLALASAPEVVDPGPTGALFVSGQSGREVACAIRGPDGPWGVLLAVRRESEPLTDAECEGYRAIAGAVANIVAASAAAGDLAHRIHRAEALRRVAGDIGSRLDLGEILGGLVDHAAVLFGGDRAAVFLFENSGVRRMAASRGLSNRWVEAVEAVTGPTLGQAAIAARRPLYSVDYRNDPRVGALYAAVVQEGLDTACLAPLLDGDSPEPLGLLGVYHDRPHPWSDDELETMAALATQASVAIKGARNFAQLATWAAQLQSIQQLGTRLNRLTSVSEIGKAIATELRQLIDYHNVRVYRVDRVHEDKLIPVAMQGQVGEYVDETPELLTVPWGSGITGWVAENRTAQMLDDAAADPRANTIAGTDADLAESMLLAPMLFEDEVLGVLVLSKLGLRQFRQDDLRLLEIYASFAAQAMANADATERLRESAAVLEQKVRGQRELLRLTESILTTFDVSHLLETIASRLGDLVGSDNLAIELVDAETGVLAPMIARGADAAFYLEPPKPGEVGLATWVLERNTPQLITDEYDDDRVIQPEGKRVHGSLLCVPLRGRGGAIGVLTMERLGEGRVFSEDEFELVQLFAAQVSIGLQNAEALNAVERRAQTDVLTGLLNHGTFGDQMAALIQAGETFSLVMLDLDRFKGVNDGLGHQAGDRLLRQVAEAIVAASRDTDSVFRYGGDEFAVLLPRTDGDQVGPIAERVRAAVASVVGPGSSWRGRARSLEASAGTSSYPVDGLTAEEVLLAADRACFVAKRTGGGRVATAAEGLALAGELTLKTPTPIDPATAA